MFVFGNEEQGVDAGCVLLRDPAPQAVTNCGVRDERSVVLGYAQIALCQRHLHEIYERPEEGPSPVHLTQNTQLSGVGCVTTEGSSGTVPGGEQKTVLGPGEHPWYSPEAIDRRVLHPARWPTAHVEQRELTYRGGLGEER